MSEVRRRALEKGDVTLEKVLEIAQALEATSIRLKGMEETETVAKISQKESKRKPAKKNDKKDNNCYRCEYKGHQQWEERCPARGKKCDNCNAIGHFAKMCKTKTAGNEKKKGGRNWERRNSEKKDRIQLTEETRGFEGICIWTDRKGCSMCNSREDCGGAGEKIVVRGVPLEVVVDSGASCNVIDEDTWKMCKIKNIKCDSRKTNKEIFAYAQNSKLELIGEFTSKTKVGRKEVMADFIVIKGKGKALIGYETAWKLEILKIGIECQVAQVEIKGSKENLFEGIGKLRNYQLKLPIDRNVVPIAQLVRIIPFQLRDKVKKQIDNF